LAWQIESKPRDAQNQDDFGSSDEEMRWSAVPREESSQPASENSCATAALENVRGSFFHIDGVGLVEERLVRSMPWVMAQCHPEVPIKAPAPSASPFLSTTPADSVRSPMPNHFAPGTEAVVEGLTKAPAFNGLSGVVQSFSTESGRYDILLALQDGSHQLAKVKGENLRFRYT